MEECRWLKPQLVAQFEFVEWTEDGWGCVPTRSRRMYGGSELPCDYLWHLNQRIWTSRFDEKVRAIVREEIKLALSGSR